MQPQSKLPHLRVAAPVCLMACGTMGLPNAYGVLYKPMADGLGVTVAGFAYDITESYAMLVAAGIVLATLAAGCLAYLH